VSVLAKNTKHRRYASPATTVRGVPRRHPSRRVWIPALSVVILLTGCAPTGGAGVGGDGALSPAPTGATTAAGASETQPSAKPAAASPSKTASAAKVAVPPAMCRASALEASAAGGRKLGRNPQDGQWQYATDFRLTNISKSTCALDGWVGVTLRGTTKVTFCEPVSPCAPPPDPDHIRPSSATNAPGAKLVTLRPNESTRFSLLWRFSSCRASPIWADFEVPHDRHVLSVLKPNLCSGPMIVTPIGQVAHKVDDGA
jgi:Protein of unknown function (DUF4232)